MTDNKKPPIDPSARDYLASKKVAPILEAFVTDLVQEKPEDVFHFMGKWALRMDSQIAGKGEPTDSPRDSSLHVAAGAGDTDQAETNALKLQSMAVRQSWAALQEKGDDELKKLAATFFTVVTTQHRSLNHTLLKDVNTEHLAEPLISLLHGVVSGHDEGELKAAAANHGVDHDLQHYHYDYFITGMLSALSIHLKDDWAVVSEPWRVVLTEITNVVRDTIDSEKTLDDGDRDDSVAKDEERATVTVTEGWKGIEDRKKNVGEQFLNLLILQHKALKRTVFKDVDMDLAAEKLVELLDSVIVGSVADDFLESLGMQYGVEYGVDPDKHASYFITTMLTTLRICIGDDFETVAEPWRLILTNISDAVSRGINELESQQTMSAEAADPSTEVAIAPETTDVLLESWGVITDKKQFATTLFNVLTTQHAVIKRSLLKEVDIDALAENHFIPLFTSFVEGKLDDEAIAAKAAEFGADKDIQQRFYHYFITGTLTALSLSMPKDDFDATAELWRLKLTHLTEVVQKALATGSEDEKEAAPIPAPDSN